MKGRTTETKRLSLFESLLLNSKETPLEEQPLKVNIKNQNQQGSKTTKSLHNLNDIFYSQEFDYADYKQSLKYNNKNLKKIALESLKNPHYKIVRNLIKVNLSGLIELKLKDIDIRDVQFASFEKQGGISKCFPKLRTLQLNCNEMTSISLQYLFQEDQCLQYLDLSSTKIDQQGLQHICQFQWNYLETLVLQWCGKLINLNPIAQSSEKMPSLRTLDCRFTQIENETINSILNSSLCLTLQNIRVYGTKVQKQSAKWNSKFIIQQLCDRIRGKQFQTLNILNKQFCNASSHNKDSMKINLIINIDTEEKCNVLVTWKLSEYLAQIQLFDLPDQNQDKCENYAILFEFLQKEWQLRNSLKQLQLSIGNIEFSDTSINVILNTIGDFKELNRLQLNLHGQRLIKPVSYFHCLTQIAKFNELVYLQLDLSDNQIELTNIFFAKLLKSIQSCQYLNLLSLNILQNKIISIEDLKYFNFQLVQSVKNSMLNHIYLMESLHNSLEYTFQDLIPLYFQHYSRIICINMEENIFLHQGNMSQLFKIVMKMYRSKFLRLLQQLQIANYLKYNQRFRREIVKEVLSYL